jgi:broad specificity phosphatase PhoE
MPILPRMLAALSILAATLLAQILPAAGQSTVLLVRHAEQTPVGGMMDGDPPLNEAGAKRAIALVETLKGAGVQAIYVSPFARSRQTAEPLAGALGLEPRVLPKDDVGGLAEHLRSHHGGQTVMVVAHSDTIPQLLKTWGHGAAVEVPRTEFNNLWVVVPREGAPPLVTRLRL